MALDLVLVEKGSFTKRTTRRDGYYRKKPTHRVTLTYDFYIGKYETTFDEYDAFCNATGRSKPSDSRWGRGQRPVKNVTWRDAIAYCNWLSEKEKLPRAYSGKGKLLDKDGRVTRDPSKVVGYRLPTEAEWEFAARGGNKSRGCKYAGSNAAGDVAWYKGNSGGKTQEVGKKAPNELGIYDMSGNVWEWCSDWYDSGYYAKSPTPNPYNYTPGSSQVVRGGCWIDLAPRVRVTSRSNYSPTGKGNYLGFRIARTVPYKGKNRPPLSPYNPSPSDEAIVGGTSVTLRWDSYDPDDDAMTYDVYLDNNVNPTAKVSSNQTENTLNRSNLSYDTTYYWKVVAKDVHGATTEGPVWKFTVRNLQQKLVFVEKGSFTMGDTWGEGDSDEKPTHKVTFTYDFYMGKYETTFDEYDAFCEATGRSKPYDSGWGRGSRPVIYVTWRGAIAYCNWLSEKENLPKAYDNKGNLLDKDGRVTTDPSKVVGYRLPTEAEWEYAARGGNKSKGYKYAGSDNVDEVAWYASNSGGKTQEVGKKAPNELGLYDMLGNICEWSSDWYGNYSSSVQTNPYNSTADYGLVFRGSCWGYSAADVRVANRSKDSLTDKGNYLGFRIARTVPYEGENRPPLSPYNPSPADDAIVGATTVTLRWDSYDPDGDTMTYDVYFDTNVNPTTKVSTNQTENTLIRSNLSYDTTYYWKVVAKDVHGATTEGPVWKFTVRNLQQKLVFVEKGSFTMGDTWGEGDSDEKPTHKVTFTYDFYMGKYEITFSEYDAFCNATGRSKPYDYGWGRGSRPVIYVSWWDAIAYCNWLSIRYGLPVAYGLEGEVNEGQLLDSSGNLTTDITEVVGYRLPTEAEWEYAARGGSRSEGYEYAGSDNVDEVAWYWQNSGDKYLTGGWNLDTMMKNNCKTQEVGGKSPNELGIYDMSGNVREWCSDWMYGYTETQKTNPYNRTAGFLRVLRGGSWIDDVSGVRVANRNGDSPANAGNRLGFRICRMVF